MKRITWLLIFFLAVGLGVGVWKSRHRVPAGAVESQDPIIIHNDFSRLPVWHPDYRTARAVEVYSGEPEQDELKDVQCPIPMKDRVKNHTGIQCVFASLEMLGRWAECKQLLEPEPLTSRPDCKSYSGPADASEKLKKYGVKFDMSYRDKAKGVALIKKAMAEGRGCLFGIPGHAMVLVHYDDEKKVVKYVNNSNSKLPVQTWTLDQFNQKWDTWVIVIYADPDVIPQKVLRLDLPNQIPIIDRNNPQGKYPKNYIPIPIKDK